MLAIVLLQATGVVEATDKGLINWSEGYVLARGYGVFDPKKGSPEDILRARRVATVVAQRNLLETIEGVHVNSTTVVKDYMLKSDVIVTHVEGVVKNARLVGEKVDRENGIVEVELMAPLEEVAQPILREIGKGKKTKGTGGKKSGKTPSAVILDASGTGLKPSMLPRIYDENGNLILDLSDLIDPNDPRTMKIMKFVDDLNQILQDPELKDNPIVIKITGVLNGRDMVVDKKSAGKLRWLKVIWELGKKVITALF